MQQLNKSGIGASEISAIVGMNPYSSPWNVWLAKTGQAPEETENPAMEWGHRLEPAIRQKYVDDTKAIVHVPPTSLFHADMPWARATPDGIALSSGCADPQFWTHLLQCKNVGTWPGKDWDKAPPVYVQIQEAWELYVTGLARADVAVLIGGSDFRIYTVHRDNKLIDDLVTIASEFWDRVESRTPPRIDESDACRRHFESRYAKSDAVELVADDELEDLFANWHRHHLDRKRIDKEVERIRNVVRSHLVEAQADRIVSRVGVAKLSKADPPTLLAPKAWGKENFS